MLCLLSNLSWLAMLCLLSNLSWLVMLCLLSNLSWLVMLCLLSNLSWLVMLCLLSNLSWLDMLCLLSRLLGKTACLDRRSIHVTLFMKLRAPHWVLSCSLCWLGRCHRLLLRSSRLMSSQHLLMGVFELECYMG